MPDTLLVSTLGFFGPIGPTEMIILGVLGLLIFGRRLPEVGRSIGRGIVEFKKGLAGIDEDLDAAGKQPPQIEPHQQNTASMGGTDHDKAPASGSAPHGSA